MWSEGLGWSPSSFKVPVGLSDWWSRSRTEQWLPREGEARSGDLAPLAFLKDMGSAL